MTQKTKQPKFQNFEIIIRNLDDPKAKPKAFQAHGLVFFAGTAGTVIPAGQDHPDLAINYGIVGDKVINSMLFFQMPELVSKFLREQQEEYERDAKLREASKNPPNPSNGEPVSKKTHNGELKNN